MADYYTDDNPYLDDAVPCPKCGNIPYERIGQDTPIMLCGIPLPTGYGTYLECGCGNRTQTYRQPWRAYLEWNKKYQQNRNSIITNYMSKTVECGLIFVCKD